MKLSIVIPVYNEKKFIWEIVGRVRKVSLPEIKTCYKVFRKGVLYSIKIE
jgi:glycosyltransferase involved in cell wall biosynthesis